jgi:hypothetical protein
MTQTKKGKEDLKEITLSDDSNLILPEISYPTPYDQVAKVKLGAKSTERKQVSERKRVSEHDLLVYQQRLRRADSSSVLTPEEIKTLIYETNQRRIKLEESIRQQKQEYMQRHDLEIEERHTREREEARQHKIAHENEVQREIRIAEEEQIKRQHAKEIQALENKCRKEKEDVTVFFEQSSGRFNSKYGNAIKKIAGETGIDRVITSRPFSSNRFAHRCIKCSYHFSESLSISKIYVHIFENKNTHMQFILNEIDKYYNTAIIEIRRKHAEADNPILRGQKLSREIESLSKLKGANLR